MSQLEKTEGLIYWSGSWGHHGSPQREEGRTPGYSVYWNLRVCYSRESNRDGREKDACRHRRQHSKEPCRDASWEAAEAPQRPLTSAHESLHRWAERPFPQDPHNSKGQHSKEALES